MIRGQLLEQTGRRILVPDGVLSPKQHKFRTLEYCLIQNTPAARRHVTKFTITRDGRLKVSIYDLPLGSSYKIQYGCIDCGEWLKRTFSCITAGKKCVCNRKARGNLLKGDRVHQDGEIIEVKKGHFGGKHAAFLTQRWCFIPDSPVSRALYANVIRKKKPQATGYLTIDVRDLRPMTQWKIEAECSICGTKTNRRIVCIRKTTACRTCRIQQASKEYRFSEEELKELCKMYEIDQILEYTNANTPCIIIKKCGCRIRQTLASLRAGRGINSCTHDSAQVFKTFQVMVCDQLGGHECYLPCGRPDCYIPDKMIVEVKLNRPALFLTFDSEDKTVAQLGRYRSYAKKHGIQFFVVVNESQNSLGDLGVLQKFSENILGWERWGLVGLSQEFIKECKRLKRSPHLFRQKIISKEDEKLAEKYVAACKRMGQLIPIHSCMHEVGVGYAKLCNIFVGKGHVRAERLAKIINEKYDLDLKVLGHTAGSRARTTWYLFEGKEYTSMGLCKLMGINGDLINGIFRKDKKLKVFIIPSGEYHSASLPNGIPPKYRGKTVKKIGGPIPRNIRFFLDGEVYSGKDLSLKMGMASGYIHDYFKKEGNPMQITFPNGDFIMTKSRPNVWPKEHWGKTITRLGRLNRKA